MTVNHLNEMLGRELGRRADGHSIFAWKNSDDLFWPAFQTGRKVLTRVEVPLILPVVEECSHCSGTGYEPWTDESVETCSMCEGAKTVTRTSDVVETAKPEYRRDRQVVQPDTWVMTKWLSDVELIWGWVGRHGAGADPAVKQSRPAPARASLEALWQSRFPGADYPEGGWRIPTNATLPRRPGGPRTPNLDDTQFFIAQVKAQTSLNFDETLAAMEAEMDANSDSARRQVEDEIVDLFPAMLNPKPGTRSSFVSFPGVARFFR